MFNFQYIGYWFPYIKYCLYFVILLQDSENFLTRDKHIQVDSGHQNLTEKGRKDKSSPLDLRDKMLIKYDVYDAQSIQTSALQHLPTTIIYAHLPLLYHTFLLLTFPTLC